MATWEKFANFFGAYYTMFIAFTAHCVFFIGCMSFSWPSPVLPKLLQGEDNLLEKPITYEESDLIGAIFYVGAAIGPLLFINLVETFGRKNVLLFLSVTVTIGYGILAFAKTVEIYYVCRTLIGLYVGASFSIEPTYVSQILAAKEREFLMACMTVFNIFGVVAAVSIGPFIPVHYFNALIAVFCFLVTTLIALGFPQSPYHCMQKFGKDKTRELLVKLRTNDVEEELEEIEKTVANEVKESYFDIFKSRENLKCLVVATIPLLLQAYSGVALIVNYSQLIFMATNISIAPHNCSIIVAVLTLCTSFLTPYFLKSKKFSQTTLLIICLSGVGFCDLIMSLYFLFGIRNHYLNWLPLGILITFVVVYNCGLDPIPWMILGKTYPMNISAMGTAISASIFQLSVFPLLLLFHKVGVNYLFLFSAGICYLGVLYVKFFVTRKIHISATEDNKNVT